MLKYLVAAAAAIYFGMLIFGDEARRSDVTRNAEGKTTEMSFAAFARPESREAGKELTSTVTDSEAVELAIQAGKSHRQGRHDAPLRGLVAAIEEHAGQEVIADSWYVSGERVNLRAGPGTGSAVVAQLQDGEPATVIGDRDGWYQIQTADGAVSGWIFGKFLTDQMPG